MSWYESGDSNEDSPEETRPDTDEEIADRIDEGEAEEWVDWIEDNPDELPDDVHIRSKADLPENAEAIHHFMTLEEALAYVNEAPGSELFLFIVADDDGWEVYRGYED